MATKLRVVIKSPAGDRRRLPSAQVTAVSWSEIRYGGFADVSVECATATAADLAGIAGGDVIEVYVAGDPEPWYRGTVTRRRPKLGEPSSRSITGYGFVRQIGNVIGKKRYVRYGGSDVSYWFRQLGADFVSPAYPSLVIRTTDTGFNTDAVDAYNVPIKDAFNSLLGYAGNQAVWGVGIVEDSADAEYLRDMLYIRPISAAPDHSIAVPGARVTAAESGESIEDICNVLTIVGGSPKYPNLRYNSSFERPTYAGQSEGDNILQDGDFEARAHWTLTGSYKGVGGSEGSPFSGSSMVETDFYGESGEQTRNNFGLITAGKTYLLSCHARQQLGAHIAKGLVEFTWLDTGGSDISTETIPSDVLTPPGVQWEYYGLPMTAPTGATGYRVTFSKVAPGNPGGDPDTPDAAVLWDTFELADTAASYQDGWELCIDPGQAVNGINWAYPDKPFHGGYCVYLDVSAATDDEFNDISLRAPSFGRFNITPAQELQFGAMLKRFPGLTTSPKVVMVLVGYDSQGKEKDHQYYDVATDALTDDWVLHAGTKQFDISVTQVAFEIAVREAGKILVDSAVVRDSAAAAGLTDPRDFYIQDGAFELTVRASDLFAGDMDHVAEAASEATYGLCQVVDPQSSITTREDALRYARAVFAVRATPPLTPPIELVDDTRRFRPGQVVNLAGPEGPTLSTGKPLPIVRVSYRWDGVLHTTIEFEIEKPDLVQQILDSITKQARLVGGNGSSMAATGTTGGSGAAVVPGVNPTADATTAAKGIVQLAGDLTGTADAPLLVDVVVGDTVGDAVHTLELEFDNQGRVLGATAIPIGVSGAIVPLVMAAGGTIPAGTQAVFSSSVSAQTFGLPAIAADTPMLFIAADANTTVNATGGDQVDGGSSATFGEDCILMPQWVSSGASFWRSIHVP